MRNFDITNAEKYLHDMVKDGWIFQFSKTTNKIYTGFKENFECIVYLNANASNDFDDFFGRISMWQPNGTAVEPPYPNYSWEEVVKNCNKCDFCGEYSETLTRIAFANKACKKCEADARKEFEFDGWYY